MPLETLSEHPDYTLLAIRGDLDAVGAAAIDPQFHAKSAAQRKHAIVDMADVQIIASLGMGLLVSCAHSMARQGKKLILINATPLCVQALRAVKIDSVVPIFDSLDEAVQSIRARSDAR